MNAFEISFDNDADVKFEVLKISGFLTGFLFF